MRILTIIILFISFSYTGQSQDTLSWSLQDCIRYARDNNINIKKAALNKETAAINYQQQKNNRLPNLSGTGAFNISRGSTIDPITSTFVSQSIVSNSYNLNSQLLVYQGNKLNLQIAKNALVLNQSELYRQEAENSIKLSVIEAYLQALYYHEGINIAEKAAASSEEELKQAQLKFEQGAIAQKDLADLETQHANNQYSLIAANNLYELQVLQLKQLLELDPMLNFRIKGINLDDHATLIADKQSLFEEAASKLPDIKIYDVQNEILTKELKISRAELLPSLSFSAGLRTGYTNTMGYTFDTQLYSNFSQQGGLTLSVPIFSRNETRNNIRLAKINIEQNKLDKIAAGKTLYTKIETAWQNAKANQTQQMAAKTSLDNAKLAYDLARKKYEFGGLTTTELSVSRNTYLSAAQSYLQSKYLATLYRELLNFYQGKAITSN